MPIERHPFDYSPAKRERDGGPSTRELFEFELSHLEGAAELAAYADCTRMEALVAILIERVDEVRREMNDPGNLLAAAADTYLKGHK